MLGCMRIASVFWHSEDKDIVMNYCGEIEEINLNNRDEAIEEELRGVEHVEIENVWEQTDYKDLADCKH